MADYDLINARPQILKVVGARSEHISERVDIVD